MGSIQYLKLCAMTREIWQWCEGRHIWITASYVSSSDNYEADIESRQTNQDSEWSLCDKAFQKIVKTFGQPDTDLFASKINHKCPKYISWKRDPGSVAVDAFTLSWQDTYFYALELEGSLRVLVGPSRFHLSRQALLGAECSVVLTAALLSAPSLPPAPLPSSASPIDLGCLVIGPLGRFEKGPGWP
nr:unnamed protein product [Callosobruchus analis]